MIHYFSTQETEGIKAYYSENGYVVIKDIIPEADLEAFSRSYEQLKSSRGYYFRSQDTNRAERLQINEEGFIERSILHPNELIFQNEFKSLTEKIVYSNIISQLLSLIGSYEKYIVWQTMFFDKSTGTVPHQDHYYLDSTPPGNLIASWFALETIHEDSGAFFVVPKSHKGPLISKQAANFEDHEEYVVKVKNLIDEQKYEFQPMPLQKGSVLLWHPFLIHGAFSNQNPNYSRKSFTAHYVPSTCSPRASTPTVSTFNPNILTWKKSNLEQAKTYLNYARYWAEVNFRSKDTRPKMEMRASEY